MNMILNRQTHVYKYVFWSHIFIFIFVVVSCNPNLIHFSLYKTRSNPFKYLVHWTIIFWVILRARWCLAKAKVNGTAGQSDISSAPERRERGKKGRECSCCLRCLQLRTPHAFSAQFCIAQAAGPIRTVVTAGCFCDYV